MKKYLSIILASVFLFACSPPDPGISSDIQVLNPGETYNTHVGKINSNFANLNTDKLEDAPSDGDIYGRQDGAWAIVPAGGGGAVDSVFGRTGDVLAVGTDYAAFYEALLGGCQTGQVKKWNGSVWYCGTDETGSGSLPPGNAANDILQWDGNAWLAQGYINGLIDDTAGDGDTTAVLSANEINIRIAAVNEVPAGGTTGQVLGKASDTDNDVAWIDQTGSGGGVTSIIAGTNITIDPTSGLGDVTINAATDSVGGYVPVPTNSDSACTEGQYAIDRANNFIYWCYAADSWDRVPSTFDQWDNPSTIYYTLTISPVPTNGRIIEPGDSTNINCGTGGNDCENDYEDGTDAVLTAIAESGYELDTWSGTNLTDNGDGTATVHIDQGISDVTATFSAVSQVVEDFSTYTEVDASGQLTVTASTASYTDMSRDSIVYLYYDKGVAWRGSADYVDYADVTCVSTTATNYYSVAATLSSENFGNISGDDGITGDAIGFSNKSSSATQCVVEAMMLENGSASYSSNTITLSQNTTYYLKGVYDADGGSNSSGAYSVSVYSDPERTTQVGTTVSIDTTENHVDYRYNIVLCNRNSSDTGYGVSGTLSNMILDAE